MINLFLNRVFRAIKIDIDLFEEVESCVNSNEESRELLSDIEFEETAKEEIAYQELRLPKLEQQLLLSMLPEDPDVGRNTIIEIRAGAGGGEASLFASDLYRMYTKLAENKNWSSECLS